MAPEIVNKTPYDYRIDIWSLGVLLYELHHREAPYKGRTLTEITKSLSRKSFHVSSSVNPEAKDLIIRILRINPSERLSLQAILSHPWIYAHLNNEKPHRAVSPQQNLASVKPVQNLQIKTESDTQTMFKISPATTTSTVTSSTDPYGRSLGVHQTTYQTIRSGGLASPVAHTNSSSNKASFQHYRNIPFPEEKPHSFLIQGSTTHSVSSNRYKDSSKYKISTQNLAVEPKDTLMVKSPSSTHTREYNAGNTTSRDKENRDFMSFVTHQEFMKRNEAPNHNSRQRNYASNAYYASTTTHKYTKTLVQDFSSEVVSELKDSKGLNHKSTNNLDHLSPTYKTKMNEESNMNEMKFGLQSDGFEPKLTSNEYTRVQTGIAPVRVQSPKQRPQPSPHIYRDYNPENNAFHNQYTASSAETNNFSTSTTKVNGIGFANLRLPDESQHGQAIGYISSPKHVTRGVLTSHGNRDHELMLNKHTVSHKYLKDTSVNVAITPIDPVGINLGFTEFYKNLESKGRTNLSPKGRKNKENEETQIQKLLNSKGPIFKMGSYAS